MIKVNLIIIGMLVVIGLTFGYVFSALARFNTAVTNHLTGVKTIHTQNVGDAE